MIYAELENAMKPFRDRPELSYPLQMWDFAIRIARDETTAGASEPAANTVLPYVPDAVMKQVFDKHRRFAILDVGTLGGYGMFDLHRRNADQELTVTGVDIDSASIELANALAPFWAEDLEVKFVCASAERLPFPPDTFHLIVARLVLPYVDVRAVLDQFRLVAAEGAVLLIQSHSYGYYWGQLRRHARSWRKMIYFIRPILSGWMFRLLGKQFGNRWWNEVALSRNHLVALCRHAGLECFWEHRQPLSGRPMLAFRKGKPIDSAVR